MKNTFLKIKIMSLAAEAQIIRREERKWPRAGMAGTRFELAQHRRFDVRSEARSAQLAYGFLRGRAYRRIEAKCWEGPNLTRIAEIVKKFGPRRDLGPIRDDIKAWMAVELEQQQKAA